MGTQQPLEKGHTHPIQFLAHVYCGHTAGWMKTPLGTEVDLVPCHIVLDGDPAPRERDTAAPLFLAHVYCGHGRPSQLLLSSCTDGRPKMDSIKGFWSYGGVMEKSGGAFFPNFQHPLPAKLRRIRKHFRDA